jgi:hypothetical protein
MDNLPRFEYSYRDGSHRYDFPDLEVPQVYLQMKTFGSNHLGQVFGVVSPGVGQKALPSSRLDLLDPNRRVDFGKVMVEREDKVPWYEMLMTILPDLQERITPGASSDAMSNPWLRAKDVPSWLGEREIEFQGLVKDLLAPGCITFVAAPRGTGKTQVMHAVCVALTTYGVFRGEHLDPAQVLLLDRDNPGAITKQRLRAWGALKSRGFKVLTREEVPDLKDREAWGYFPTNDYDVVIIDSFNSFIEGITEKEGKPLTEALATLKDISGQGPAFLVLHNCTKDGTTFKGREDIVDRADIFYEVRDATDFIPKNPETWWEELPDAGEQAWANRTTRRKGRSIFRLAFIATKFRLGPTPEPFCIEIRLPEGGPWTLADVTADLILAGEAENQAQRQAHEDATTQARARLAGAVQASAEADRPMTKQQAETYLCDEGLTRKEARTAIMHGVGAFWRLEHRTDARGKPWLLFPVLARAGVHPSTARIIATTDSEPPEPFCEYGLLAGLVHTDSENGGRYKTTHITGLIA